MTNILSQKEHVGNRTNSNAVISKSENISSTFLYISGIYMKFEILWKKDEPQGWFVSETKNCKKHGYLNA